MFGSRIRSATSIEDAYGTVFAKAGISGYEFLEKIVQLPFCLPNLADDKKLGFVNKTVEQKELDVSRVLGAHCVTGASREFRSFASAGETTTPAGRRS